MRNSTLSRRSMAFRLLACAIFWCVSATASATKLVNLLVENDGLHRVTYEQLANSGVDLEGVRHAKLSLTKGGQLISVFSKGQTSEDRSQRKYFGPGGYLEFYAEADENLYSKETAFSLHINRKLRKNFGRVQGLKIKNSAGFLGSYQSQVEFEQNNYYDYLAPSKTDPWHFGRVLASGGATGEDHIFNLSNVVDPIGSMSVEVFGIVDFEGVGDDHHVEFFVNGAAAGGQTFEGNRAITLDLPTEGLAVNLLEGENTLRMDLVGIEGQPFDAVALNKATIQYTRSSIAQAGQLEGRFAAGQHQVSGFASKDLRVYVRASGGAWKILRGIRKRTDNAGYAVRFHLAEAAQVAIVSADGAPGIAVAMIEDEVDISSGLADYLIIAHPSFIGPELQNFVSYRAQSSGLTTKTVDVTQIYAQFGQGVPNAKAIRDYVRFAAQNLGVRYVLLVGGDQFDYKQYQSSAVSHVPTMYATTPGGQLLIRQNPVDSLYGDLDGDEVPDIAVGRFPVRTVEELAILAEKVADYEAGANYQHMAVVIADVDDNGNGVSFEPQAESLIQKMPIDWQQSVVRVFPQTQGGAAAKQLLDTNFAEGARLFSYVGHSSEQLWSRSTPPLMKASEIAGLNNIDKPTVVTQWGCWNTYFVKPASNSMSQAFLLNSNGAATILGASSLTTITSEQALGELLQPLLLQPGTRIGDAVTQAKQALAVTMPSAKDVILGWQILGDPALVINPAP